MNYLISSLTRKKIILVLTTSIILFPIILISNGCGGSNSGSEIASIFLSPDDAEVRALLNRFATSLNKASSDNSTDTTAIMSDIFDSNLKYYKYLSKPPYTLIGYNDLSNELKSFLTKDTAINMEFKNITVISGAESAASAHATLAGTYIDSNGVNKTFNEEVEIDLVKVGTWGITKFGRYDHSLTITGTNFPPLS